MAARTSGHHKMRCLIASYVKNIGSVDLQIRIPIRLLNINSLERAKAIMRGNKNCQEAIKEVNATSESETIIVKCPYRLELREAAGRLAVIGGL